MSGDKLTPLQRRILRTLAGRFTPPWTLTGGAALAGFHLKHRPTRDLDLFWYGQGLLGALPREVEEILRVAGLDVATVQGGVTFHQLRVTDGANVCIVDLVAERAVGLERPIQVELDGLPVLIDSPDEILVNKLCALLGRAELRDLLDLKALLESGLDLGRALAAAPQKDGGFSALTLAWVLKDLRPAAVAKQYGLSDAEAAELATFHDQLIQRLLASTAPE